MSRNASLVGVFAMLAALILMSRPGEGRGDDKEPTGRIKAPKEGSTFAKGETFKVSVKAKNIPKGHLVYACIEAPKAGLIWPKKELTQFRAGEDMTAEISEGGDQKDFRLSILLIPPGDGVKFLEKWFEKGMTNGDFPGIKLSDIAGATRLDSIKLELKD